MLYQKTETLTPHSARAGTGARTHQVWKETLLVLRIYVKVSFSIRKVPAGQANFGSCCLLITRLKPPHENHAAALFPPCFPASPCASRSPHGRTTTAENRTRKLPVELRCTYSRSTSAHETGRVSDNRWLSSAPQLGLLSCPWGWGTGLSGGTPRRLPALGHHHRDLHGCLPTDAHNQGTEVTPRDVFHQQNSLISTAARVTGSCSAPGSRVRDGGHAFEPPQN